MTKHRLTVQELRDLIHEGKAADPLVFLESIMNGQDPRELSSIYKLIMDIDDLTDGDITKSDWEEIVDHVVSRFKYRVPALNESITASKTLAEYIHPKRKHIELSGGSDTGNVANSPLTEEEIELFKERFNDEF